MVHLLRLSAAVMVAALLVLKAHITVVIPTVGVVQELKQLVVLVEHKVPTVQLVHLALVATEVARVVPAVAAVLVGMAAAVATTVLRTRDAAAAAQDMFTLLPQQVTIPPDVCLIIVTILIMLKP